MILHDFQDWPNVIQYKNWSLLVIILEFPSLWDQGHKNKREAAGLLWYGAWSNSSLNKTKEA